MPISRLARQLVVQTLKVVTCLLTTSSCTCGTENIGEKSLFINASAYFNDATQGLNPGKSTLGETDVLCGADTSPTQPSAPPQTWTPGELRSVPSTEPFSSGPA